MDRPVSKVREAKLELYRKKGKIHAKAVTGRFNTLRWGMVWLTQAIFYGLCWLDWGSAGSVRQAVLFDIAHEKLYLFGLVLWPQDALLLAFVLIIAATALFLVTAWPGACFAVLPARRRSIPASSPGSKRGSRATTWRACGSTPAR